MAIQTLIDGATSLTIDKQVPTSMSVSRGQKLRTQSRSISIYKFVVGLNPGLSYDTFDTRGLLNDYDVQGKITEETVKLGNVTGNQYITEYLGEMTGSEQASTYITGHSGNVLTINVAAVLTNGASGNIVNIGDFIQAANARYPYQATAKVLRGSGTTVDIPVHRDIIETNTGANLVYGNNVTFKVKMIDQPPYSITPGRYVEWGGDMQLMENLT